MTTCIAMQLSAIGAPLHEVERPLPVPGTGEVLIAVSACGVCRTDLHVIDSEVAARLPIVPGHEIVGRIIGLGADTTGVELGQRVGVPWLGSTCGACPYCRSGRENLCDRPVFTGASRDGGYATHVTADARFCLALPDCFADEEAAPLLCAGLIGYRALSLAGSGNTIGLYGFGAAAHIIAQVAAWQGRTIYAFTRPGDTRGQDFARSLGCAWAGGSDEAPPAKMEAAIIFAPDGKLVPMALRAVSKGGRVVCDGIHMSDIPAFPYADLWEERVILSVANLTRADGHAFMTLAEEATIRTHVTTFPLARANEAIGALREGRLDGAAVLLP